MSYCICAPFGCCIYPICSLAHGHIEGLCPIPLAPLFSTNENTKENEYFIVTGGNRGVGYYTARILLQRGHSVIILSRNGINGEKARDSLIRSTGNSNCKSFQVDLNDLDTVSLFINHVKESGYIVRGLVNNAGMIGSSSMAANHIGHFALTLGLLPGLRKGVTKYGRVYVVNVSSVANFDGSVHIDQDISNLLSGRSGAEWNEYAGSKAANALFGLSFQRHYLMSSDNMPLNKGISLVSMHPGVMLTDLWRNCDNTTQAENIRCLARTLCCVCIKHPAIAAIGLSSLVDPRSCFTCFDKCSESFRTAAIGSASGEYFQQSFCCCILPVRPSPILRYESLQVKLWNDSFEFIAFKSPTLFSELEGNVQTTIQPQGHTIVSAALPCTEFLAVYPYFGLSFFC